MKRSRNKCIFLLLFFLPTTLLMGAMETQLEKAIEIYMEENGITGISAAVIGREDHQKFQKIISRGNLSKKSPIPVNNYTEFRLGPITQLFTAAVLAYYVKEGQVSLDDPVSKFMPRSMNVPTFEGREITLGDLATHTSALPDMPYSLSSRASFSVSQMIRFLSKYELLRAPGTKYEYSYFGYALLSNILSRIAKSSFPTINSQLILTPLYIKETTFTLSHEQKTRLTTGYELGHGISPLLSEKLYSVFIGAGGLYSTPLDMLTFLSFNLGKIRTSLTRILSVMQTPYHTFNDFQVGLGWTIVPYKASHLYSIGGSLFGFSTYLAMVPDQDIGVVILANHGETPIDTLGEQLLNILSSP